MIIEGLIILIPRPHPERKDENYFLKKSESKKLRFQKMDSNLGATRGEGIS